MVNSESSTDPSLTLWALMAVADVGPFPGWTTMMLRAAELTSDES